MNARYTHEQLDRDETARERLAVGERRETAERPTTEVSA
jgi:hypothetical protein